MKIKNFFVILTIAVVLTPVQTVFSMDCSHGATTSARGNNLYLYFPTASDNTFPEFSPETTSPLAAFDVADLDGDIGTTAQLRDRIFGIVTEDYCEFNVEVIQTTTSPNVTDVSRWNIVGVGSDTSGAFGYAQTVDIGDVDPKDYGRVWAASFDDSYGGPGGALNGANSTLERWATAIGHTTSHEAGHNYGLGHSDSAARTGEDIQNNHNMATGSTGLTGEQRASTNRHFSDRSYELLAYNVGLNIQTVYNWDFINPNAEDAHSLEITLLSSASSLSIGTWWNGLRSPWRDPTITNTGSTRTFQGTTYNEFILNFNADKSWSGGADGIVPGGAEFHIGAGFGESDLVIVYDTKLKNSGGSDLTLHPRMAGFDAGAADLASGDFEMAMFNSDPDSGDMIIRDMNIQFLPRLVDINAMLVGEEMRDVRGIPIDAHGTCDPRSCNPRKDFDLKVSKKFHLGKLSDDRYVDITYDANDCKQDVINGAGDLESGEEIYCPDGNALSLFPATSIYVTATIVDPSARYFDQESGSYINGPLESKVFYQFVGIVPDFNENGVDDLIDIRVSTSIDENGNGVVDEAEPSQPTSKDDDKSTELPWWIYLIWAILILLIVVMYLRQRKLNSVDSPK